MGPEAVPRQVLCEEFSGTLVKPCKNEGGRNAIRYPSGVKKHEAGTLINLAETNIPGQRGLVQISVVQFLGKVNQWG